MKKYDNLVKAINALVKKHGQENADSVIAGMMLVKTNYFSLKQEIEGFLNN